jgi:hypothetical protein
LPIFASIYYSFFSINLKKEFKMRKIAMTLFAAVLMVSFAACDGAKKTDDTAQAVETEVVEEQAPAPEAVVPVEPTPAEALKAFQNFAKEYGEAFNNMTKDPQKYMKLAGQMQQQVADMERIKVDLSPKQVKDYEKALKIIKDVSSGGSKK